MLRTFTCIMCPQGCEITVKLPETPEKENPLPKETSNPSEKEKTEKHTEKIYQISGNRCPRGAEYVTQELENPLRNIATSILVEGGELPLASVRLTKSIPRERLFDVMAEIKKITVPAPVKEGEIVIANVLGLESDVIVTKDIEKKEP